ncbi:DUF2929 family protein [Halalkalibacillus halophilus]|uniref:DUF2929 family protein n=1 Tax=Halalkalibacillus halophilus TaxID=392827 RepID=UPI000413F92D|nr:DUF2929 family protein [Halalkalibacillus halophilus]
MRLIWTAAWSFMLSAMIVYVIGSMAGDAFSISGTIALAITFTLVTVILSETILKDESSQ